VPPEQRDALGLPAQIARVERAASEVAGEPGVEGRAPVALPGPLELLSGAVRVETAPCLRLLDLDYDLLDFCAALERGEHPALPGPEPTSVAVTRAHWQVRRGSLEGWQAQFLGWCQAQRRPIALCEWPAGDGDGVARVMLWLPAAIDGGLLQLSGVTARPT
jgi:hypothetical protein